MTWIAFFSFVKFPFEEEILFSDRFRIVPRIRSFPWKKKFGYMENEYRHYADGGFFLRIFFNYYEWCD